MPVVSLPLHRGWEFFEPRRQQWFPAEVPGCIHLDLHRQGLIPDPFYGSNERDLAWIERADWEYRLIFDADPVLLPGHPVELVADGLDTLATITLNGWEIARTENMFTGYRFPLGRELRATGNELTIHFASPMPYIKARQQPGDFPEWNDPVGGCSHIRKQQCSFGWDWGPRFPTCGIYRGIRLEASERQRLGQVRVSQTHQPDGSVVLRVQPLRSGWTSYAPLARNAPTFPPLPPLKLKCRLSFDGKLIAESNWGDMLVSKPRLWWPNDQGAQPLYELEVEGFDGEDGRLSDTWRRRIGLRTVALDRTSDEDGESFRFVVNGQPIFAKGANWIPAHAFVSAVTRADYDDLLTSAAEAHMNMIRVWGGGIYESDDFYDLCDEKGLLVWQDFMFSCALYPADEHFLGLVKAEAVYQIGRLDHHACLALWCGNNEIEQMPEQIAQTPERAADYEQLFYKLLPELVEKHAGSTAYWPSSPHNPAGWREGFNSERAGDAHFWDVWHARKPVKNYEATRFRFCSEFGMQSYSSPKVAASFCPPEEFNVFSPAMENHQKNSAGNQIILDYLSRRYRFPKDYASLAYLSQLNQAYCMKIGVEHFRRSMPRTMGALYWQLNDCWPVFSWSSLEFGGNWKALHHEAKRFFAPALVSAHVPGDERLQTGNTLVSTIHDVNLHTVYDGAEPECDARLGWALHHLDGRRLAHGGKAVRLRQGESILQEQLAFAPQMAAHGAGDLYLHFLLTIGGRVASQDTLFLTAPRFLRLQRAPVQTQVEAVDARTFRLHFTSPVFQHRVQWTLPGVPCRADDNFFDLLPHWPRQVTLRMPADAEPRTPADIQSRLQTMSLVDSY